MVSVVAANNYLVNNALHRGPIGRTNTVTMEAFFVLWKERKLLRVELLCLAFNCSPQVWCKAPTQASGCAKKSAVGRISVGFSFLSLFFYKFLCKSLVLINTSMKINIYLRGFVFGLF